VSAAPPEPRVVLVHDAGGFSLGWSAEWTACLAPYVDLPPGAYVETLWEAVFDPDRPGLQYGPPANAGEAVRRYRLEEELLCAFQARVALGEPFAPAPTGPGTLMRYAEAYAVPGEPDPTVPLGMQAWLVDPAVAIAAFGRYLTQRAVRDPVRASVAAAVRAQAGHPLVVVAHRWGGVVAYEALQQVAAETAGTLPVASLILLGAPLWAVRPYLDDQTGSRPGGVARVVSVSAADDPSAAWLTPIFAVDDDLQTAPGPGYTDPANAAVWRDVVAAEIRAAAAPPPPAAEEPPPAA
jgi:hypothetical protein